MYGKKRMRMKERKIWREVEGVQIVHGRSHEIVFRFNQGYATFVVTFGRHRG